MENETPQLSRKARERLYKRQEIVNAAREVFASRGFTAATLDEIAERVRAMGVRPGVTTAAGT